MNDATPPHASPRRSRNRQRYMNDIGAAWDGDRLLMDLAALSELMEDRLTEEDFGVP